MCPFVKHRPTTEPLKLPPRLAGMHGDADRAGSVSAKAAKNGENGGEVEFHDGFHG